MNNNVLVSLPEYARIHRVDQSTVRKKILAGNFPAQKIGRNWLIARDEPWVDNRKRKENVK